VAKGAERVDVVSQQRAAARQSEKNAEKILVIHGVYPLEVRVTGRTIASVRDALARPLNIGPQAVALVNGQAVDHPTCCQGGEVLEFARHAGEKGMGHKTRRAFGVEPGPFVPLPAARRSESRPLLPW
jgi:hypothetical protein